MLVPARWIVSHGNGKSEVTRELINRTMCPTSHVRVEASHVRVELASTDASSRERVCQLWQNPIKAASAHRGFLL